MGPQVSASGSDAAETVLLGSDGKRLPSLLPTGRESERRGCRCGTSGQGHSPTHLLRP